MAKRKKRRGGKTSGRTAAPATGATRGAPKSPAGPGPILDRAILALATAGMLLTAYLTWIAWAGEHPAYCTEGSDCDIVQSSRWSTFLGLPVALWGLITYALLARVAWVARRKPSRWHVALAIAACAFAISAYLTAVSVLVIDAVCAYCLVSFAIVTALLVLVCLRRPADKGPGFAWRRALPGPTALAVALVAGMHLHYSGLFDPAAGPEKPRLRALATHLADSGAKFYGAYWCPRCEDQKELFEASAHRLPYVECSPEGRGGPKSTACVVNDIQSYPTWIVGDRRYPGVQTPRRLARYSGFDWPAEQR